MKNNEISLVDIIKNIWINKVYRLVFALTLIFVISSHNILHKYVFEAFYNEMVTYVLAEAKQVGNHIAVHQNGSMKNEVLDLALSRIMKDFSIQRIKLFDADGYVVNSTKKDDIGKKNKHDYFYTKVKKGEMFYKIVSSGGDSADGETQIKDVAEIYVPMFENGIFVGASEIYYDVTDKKASLDGLIKTTDHLFMVVMMSFQSLVLVMLYFVSRNNLIKIKSDEDAKKMDALMQEQSRLAALGEMIGNIAHQWRQPLSTITTYATGLKVKKDFASISHEDIDDMVENVMKNAKYLSKTIDDFRNFIKNDSPKENFYIQNSVQKALEIIDATLKENYISVDIEHSESLMVSGYENELMQVFINILNNAKDILINEPDDSRHIKIKFSKLANNFVQVNIQDCGGGIPADIMDKIFDPYFTTKHQSQGTGLGLYMSSQIIKNHFGGNFYVKNNELIVNGIKYLGASFFIELPIAAEQ